MKTLMTKQRPLGIMAHSIQALCSAIVMALLVKFGIYAWLSYQHGVGATVSQQAVVFRSDRAQLTAHSPLTAHVMQGVEMQVGRGWQVIINAMNTMLAKWPEVNRLSFIATSHPQRLSVSKVGQVIKLSVQSVWLKSGLLLSALVLYVSAVSLGILDGLCARYVRTVEAGRESAYWFQWVSAWIAILPAWWVFVYLVLPIDKAIGAVIDGLAFSHFILSAQVCRYFKKYV